MPRAEAGTAKAIGNAIKAKGLGRLRWYCQVCQKQCRDENGFKMHSQSEGHIRAMLVVGENAGRHINDFSQQFQKEFLQLLSRKHGTQQVRANQVYNEYIQDKNHLHMNSTRWVSLTEFVKYLGREGIVRAEENEKGWWISWVDNTPKALARQAEAQKRERADMDDEQRQRKQLKEQIERARVQAEALREQEEAKMQGLKRDEGAPKVALSFSLAAGKKSPGGEGSPVPDAAQRSEETKPAATPPSEVESKPSTESTTSAIPPAAKVSIGNPLKRPSPSLNVFKQASKSAKTSSSSTPARSGEDTDGPSKSTLNNLAGKKFLTAAEKLMLEDIERKKRGGPGSGPSRGIGYQGMGPSRGPARR
ncbi:hypothetical protein NCC49_001549 [Naganishia albida]|nr:hypothetical protein NCC49_001549 [Naganishia albida]